MLVDHAEVARLCAKIQKLNKHIPLLCEANSMYKIGATPNDPRFTSQYAHALQKIHAEEMFRECIKASSKKS